MKWLVMSAFAGLLAAAQAPVPMPAGGFDRTLSQLQGRVSPAYARQDLELFNQAFDRQFASTWNARPAAARRDLLTNTMNYLGAVRGLNIRDVNTGVALSNAYRRVARFQEGIADPSVLGAGWAMGPVYGYQNSALILTQLANQNPNDPYVRGELVLDVGRIRALGGSMPIMVSVPVGGAPAQQQERGIPNWATAPAGGQGSQGGQGQPSVLASLPSVPAVDIVAVPASDQEAARKALDRYTSVLVTAATAQEGLRHLQESVNAMGFSLHPDTVRALTRMRVYLEMAAREIEAGRYADSLESLGIAEGEARKALKVIGR